MTYGWLRSQTHAAVENKVNESKRVQGWIARSHIHVYAGTADSSKHEPIRIGILHALQPSLGGNKLIRDLAA